MKTLKTKFAILLVTLLSISCSRSDDTPAATTLPVANDNYIRCNVDGIAYEALGAAVIADQNSVAFNFRSDISGGGTGIDVSVNGQAAVGTYTLNYSTASTAGRLNYRLSGDIYSSSICSTSVGTLTITSKNNKTIIGTFSFSGKKILGCSNAAKVITTGTFKVTFP